MITDQLDNMKFCYQLIITLTKFVLCKVLFLKSKQKKFQIFLQAVKKSVPVMVHTVQLLRRDKYCPIKLSY